MAKRLGVPQGLYRRGRSFTRCLHPNTRGRTCHRRATPAVVVTSVTPIETDRIRYRHALAGHYFDLPQLRYDLFRLVPLRRSKRGAARK